MNKFKNASMEKNNEIEANDKTLIGLGYELKLLRLRNTPSL